MSSKDNRITNNVIKFEVRQLQLFTNSSNLNAANKTPYTVYPHGSCVFMIVHTLIVLSLAVRLTTVSPDKYFKCA